MDDAHHSMALAPLPYSLYRARELKLRALVFVAIIGLSFCVYAGRVLSVLCSQTTCDPLESCNKDASSVIFADVRAATDARCSSATTHWWQLAACGCLLDAHVASELLPHHPWVRACALAGACLVNRIVQALWVPWTIGWWVSNPGVSAFVALWALMLATLTLPFPMIQRVAPAAQSASPLAAAASSSAASNQHSAGLQSRSGPACQPAASARKWKIVWCSSNWYCQVAGARCACVVVYRLGLAATRLLGVVLPPPPALNPFNIWPRVFYLWPCWIACTLLLPMPLQLHLCVVEAALNLYGGLAMTPELARQPMPLALHALQCLLLVVVVPLLVSALFERSCASRYAVQHAQQAFQGAATAEKGGQPHLDTSASGCSSQSSSGCSSKQSPVCDAHSSQYRPFIKPTLMPVGNTVAAGAVPKASSLQGAVDSSVCSNGQDVLDDSAYSYKGKLSKLALFDPMADEKTAAAAAAPVAAHGCLEEQQTQITGRHGANPLACLDAPSRSDAVGDMLAGVGNDQSLAVAAGDGPSAVAADVVARARQEEVLQEVAQLLGADTANSLAAVANRAARRKVLHPYQPRTQLTAVGIKVHTPDHDVERLSPVLRGCLAECLQQAAGAPLQGVGLMWASSTCIPGCVQLLASVYHMHASAQSAGGGDDAGDGDDGDGGPPSMLLRSQGLVQQLVATLQSAQSKDHASDWASFPVEVLAGSVHAALPAAGSAMPQRQPPGPQVLARGAKVCWMEPPALAADQQQPAEVLVMLQPFEMQGHDSSTTTLQGKDIGQASDPGGSRSCTDINQLGPSQADSADAARCWRVVVFSEQRTWLDTCVPSGEALRVAVPALPVGVYHLTVLDETPGSRGGAAGSVLLLLQPLVVLPGDAAAELQQLWIAACSAVVNGAAVGTTADGSDDGGEEDADAVVAGLVDAPKAATLAAAAADALADHKATVWQHLMGGLLQDIAGILSAPTAAAASADAKGAVAVAAQGAAASATACSTSVAVAGAAGEVATMLELQRVLDPLLRHLSMHHMWATAALLVGHLRKASADGTLPAHLCRASEPAEAPTGIISRRLASRQGPGRAAAAAERRASLSEDEASCCGAAAAAAAAAAAQWGSLLAPWEVEALGVQMELSAGGPQLVRQLLLGFPARQLEQAYVQYVHRHTVRVLDAWAGIFPLLIIMGHGMLAGVPAAAAVHGWPAALKLHWAGFVTVFLWAVVPGMVLVMVLSVKAGARWREFAHALGEWAIAIVTVLMALRLVDTGHHILRVMVASVRGDMLVVLGMGVVKPLSRQVRLRMLLPPLLVEAIAQVVMAWRILGWQWRTLVLRSLILMVWCCSKGSVELTSRRLFLRSLQGTGRCRPAASAAAVEGPAGAAAAGADCCSSGAAPRP